MAKRAVLKIAQLHEATIFLPLAVAVLPAQPQRTQAGASQTMDAALRVGTLLHLIDRRAGQFVDARRVGHERPDHLGRLFVTAFFTVMVKALHHRFPSGSRDGTPLCQYTKEPQYGFVISGNRGFAPILPEH